MLPKMFKAPTTHYEVHQVIGGEVQRNYFSPDSYTKYYENIDGWSIRYDQEIAEAHAAELRAKGHEVVVVKVTTQMEII